VVHGIGKVGGVPGKLLVPEISGKEIVEARG
jgi:hypothetical protein